MPQISPYLTFIGNCEEAFIFYRSVFGGEFIQFNRFNEMPPVEGKTMPAEDGEKIMHVSLPIADGITLMGSDTGGEWAPNFIKGNNISLSVNTSSEDEAKRIFEGLSAGGMVTMPLEKTFWGALFGMFVDKFGIPWMVNYDYPRG